MPACLNRARLFPCSRRRQGRADGTWSRLVAAAIALLLPLTAAAEPEPGSAPPRPVAPSPSPPRAAETHALSSPPRAGGSRARPRAPIVLPPSEDKVLAEALFQRGLAEMRRGRFAEACSALEQSQAIEFGIGTMLYLAECYEYQGRTASAWALFREAAAAARAEGQNERAKMGTARAARLEPRVSKLAVHVPEFHALPSLLVLRDGQPMPRAWIGGRATHAAIRPSRMPSRPIALAVPRRCTGRAAIARVLMTPAPVPARARRA